MYCQVFPVIELAIRGCFWLCLYFLSGSCLRFTEERTFFKFNLALKTLSNTTAAFQGLKSHRGARDGADIEHFHDSRKF